mgnify:FL=1
MDANLNFLTPASSKATSTGAPSTSGGLDPNLAKPMSGQEFAGVMRDLMAKGERQDVAGMTTGTSTDGGVNGLQTLALGNQFEVITTATPLPDSSSLAQFARAQGLSESAVQALFGDLYTPKAAGIEVALSVPATDTLALNTQPFNPAVIVPNLGLMGMTSLGLPTTQVIQPNNSTDLNTLTLLPTTTAQGWVQTGASSAKVADLTVQGLAQTGASSAKVADLLQVAGASGVIQSMTGFGMAPSNALGSADQLAELAPEIGPLDAMRMRMVPAWENMTRQLAQMKNSDQTAAWGQLTASILNSRAQGETAQEISLDLGADDPDLMATLDALQERQGQPGLVNLESARNTASTGSLGAAATSAALANPGLTDRAAQIQDLADKLGKAMGERLQEQLESGEWKLQLKLNPAHLGKIDVELDMNASGLDAVFKSDNLLTRELIIQGMPKLKDSLSQSGMTVANVWVNSENQRGSGGNSTPRQQNGSNQDVQATVKEVSGTETRVKDLRSSNAWDTLA